MVDDDLSALSRGIARQVHTHRTAQAMSLGELARTAGLSKTIVARIERGDGNPSVETLWRLATALGLPLSSLLVADAAPRVRIVRAGEGRTLRGGSGMVARLVHAEARGHRSELFELELPAGAEQHGSPHLPGTEELVICLAGRLEAGPTGEEAVLRAGDAVWFAADVAHRYAGLEASRALDWLLYP